MKRIRLFFDKKAGIRLIALIVLAIFLFNIGPLLNTSLRLSSRRHEQVNHITQLVNKNRRLNSTTTTANAYIDSTNVINIETDYNDLFTITYSDIPTTPTPKPKNKFDEECDRTGEWESIGNHSFFKRTAAYYFLDATMLNMYYMKLSSRQHNYTLQIEVLQHDQVIAKFNVSQSSNRKVWQANQYFFGGLSAYYTGVFMEQNNLSSYQMRVIVGDSVSGEQTNSYINVKIKNLNTPSAKKKGSLLCAKCFNISFGEYYLPMKWWIEMNKRAGFDKLVMCDQRVEAHPAIDSLFKRYENFLEVTTLRCIPNLQPDARYSDFKYLKRYVQMSYGKDYLPDNNKKNNMNMLMINECYLDNIDKYKYIAHIDNDELIISHHANSYLSVSDLVDYVNSASNETDDIDVFTSEFQCSRQKPLKEPKKQANITSGIELYMNEIIPKAKFKKTYPTSYYFGQGYYLDHQIVDQIFERLEDELNQIDLERILGDETESIVVYLNVTEHNRASSPLVKGPLSFLISIKSHRELRYAANMLKLYKKYFKPYIQENVKVFGKHIQDYDRFFAFVGPVNRFALGKTLHNTQATFDMTVHLIEFFTDKNVEPPQLVRDGNKSRINAFSYDLAHLSHFRKHQNYRYTEVPFEYFIVDLNYFNCYFRPVMNKFLKEPF